MIAKLESRPFGSNEKLYSKLTYSIQKMEEGRCVFLYDNSFLNNVNLLYKEMNKVGDLSDRTKMKYNEVSISLPPGENIDDEKFREIAIDYMERLGYGNSCYNVWRHFDKEHEHVHILFTTVDYQGNWINDFETKKRSQKISREIEKQYGLQEVVYNRFNNEPLTQIKARQYFFDNALKKGLRGYNSKSELHAVIPDELLEKLVSNKFDNETIRLMMGEELYTVAGNILEKHKLFKTLYKNELIEMLDNIYEVSSSRSDFFNRIEAAGIYIRMVTYKGEHAYCYGLPDVNIYFKDKQLPARYRYSSISKFGKKYSNELLESEQKNRIYNKVFLALKNAKNFDDFKLELKKLSVTLLEYKNSGGVYGIGFRLDYISNAVDFKATDISRRISYGKLNDHFEGKGGSLTVLLNDKPMFIQSLLETEIANGYDFTGTDMNNGHICFNNSNKSSGIQNIFSSCASNSDDRDDPDDFLKKKKRKKKDRGNDI